MAEDLKLLAQELTKMRSVTQRLTPMAHGVPGTMIGQVVSVNDPLDRGRVQVILENSNPYDTGQTSSNQATPTAWVTTADSFIGKQSKHLVGQRVVLHTAGNDPNNLVVGNVIHDDNTEAPAVGTTMTKLPLYPSGSLPEACTANLGCTVVELDGPHGSDWLCTCLRRSGSFVWVRHMDLYHTHDSQDSDSDGDSEGTVHDDTKPTSQNH